MKLRVLVLAVIVPLHGCAFDVACQDDADCLEGYGCVDGRCRAGAEDAGEGPPMSSASSSSSTGGATGSSSSGGVRTSGAGAAASSASSGGASSRPPQSASVSSSSSSSGGIATSSVPDAGARDAALPPGCQPETCNNRGTDDDCDGNAQEIGDGIEALDTCVAGNGICRDGYYECPPSGAQPVCVAVATPQPETCQNTGIDNDCDGNTADLANGENLNGPCSTGLLGTCGTGEWQCVQGNQGCVQTVFPAGETCADDGVDNDCDGIAIEIDNVGQACTVPAQVGACANGVYACEGNTLVCPQQTFPGTEDCYNAGFDDDCDGNTSDVGIDPQFGGDIFVESYCQSASGNCYGTWYCAGGQQPQCYFTSNGNPEACNGIDDNCDGDVDGFSCRSGFTCSSDQPNFGTCACQYDQACNYTGNGAITVTCNTQRGLCQCGNTLCGPEQVCANSVCANIGHPGGGG